MDQNRLAGFQLGIVEQHVFAGAEGNRGKCGADIVHAIWSRDYIVGGHVGIFARITVEMEAVDALRADAVIMPALAAGAALAADLRAVNRNEVTGLHIGNPGADGRDHR